jgi:pimeloyl-ACP methyl ester carboxylesterase
MQYSAPAQGFRLAYERTGSGDPVVLLHGWPGDHTDYDQLALECLVGVGHFTPLEATQRFASAIRDAARRAPAPRFENQPSP